MRRRCFFLLIALWVPLSLGAEDKPVIGIAVVMDGPSPVFRAAVDDIEREVRSQLSDRYDVERVELSVDADWTAESVERQLDAAYADDRVSVVFGLGLDAIAAIAKRMRLPKPTILPYVMAAQRLGLPKRGDVSGRKNLTYITEDLDVAGEAEFLRAVAGSKRVVVLAE